MSGEGRARERPKIARNESEGLFQAIFLRAAVGIAQTNVEGNFLLLNDHFCDMMGYTLAELHGKTFLDLTHPDDRGAALEGRRRLLAGEVSSHSIEKRYVRKDGTFIWGRRCLSLVRDQNNVPQYFIAVVEDIGAKAEAEEALRESELLNKQVFDNIPVCVFLLDVTSDGRFTFRSLNPAEEKAVGLASSEVSGKFIDEVLPEDVSKKVIANYRRCVEAGSPISYEDELNLEAGRRYFHTNLIPLRNASGRIHQIAGCCTDLTDVKRAQEEALARQKLESIGVLASGIAHDFNNLLGSILGCTEIALTDCSDAKAVEEQLYRIRMASIRGAEIVRQLMIYGGNESAEFQPVDVSAIVDEMLHLLKVSISKHAILKIELRDDLPAVLASPTQIRQLVMNLITNASEAIEEQEGTIRITSGLAGISGDSPVPSEANLPEGDYIKLEIYDTGSGMTPEVQARVFDPFFTTKQAGRGLGLPVVQGIVRTHGGGIRLRSVPGQGTTFQIFLPCMGVRTTVSSIPPVRKAKLLPKVGTILVVEDEGILRSAVSKSFQRSGFSVIEASDGTAAIDLIRVHKNDLDVVLLDVTLPGSTSSRDVLEEARRLRAGLKIIITSAYSKEYVEATFTGLHIERFIRKPFLLSDLMGVVQDCLSAQ